MKLIIDKEVSCHKTDLLESGKINIQLLQISHTDEATKMIMIVLESKDDEDAYLSFEIDKNDAKYIEGYLNAFINEKDEDNCQEV